jgi:hypothetical protein
MELPEEVVDDVIAQLDTAPPWPRLLAITTASNVTGWLPPIDEIIDAAHARGIPVLVDAAQLAAHCRLPAQADYLAWSGHKMYAPFGGGVLIGPRDTFAEGDPFLAGGGAVDLVDLDEVVWTDPPDREEAGSPTSSGRSLSTPPSTSSPPSAGPTSPPTTTTSPVASATAWPVSTGSASSAPTAALSPSRSLRSSSKEYPTPWSRHASAPSTPSASATGAFAPTPTSPPPRPER